MVEDVVKPLDISTCQGRPPSASDRAEAKQRRAWNVARQKLMKTHDCFNCPHFNVSRCNPLNGCKMDKKNER